MSEANYSECDLNFLLCCDHCNNGDGDSVYPYYGLAPHKHDMTITGSVIGSTVVDKESNWPDNFSEDPEVKGCGTYTHCLICSSGAT